jgi:hypothetical protein
MQNKKLVLYGIILWVVPFVASFLFFDMETQELTIDETFFKSIMIVLSALLGVALLVDYFKGVKKDFVMQGAVAGFSWAAISWVLDIIILVPMMDGDLVTYFMQVGMRYLIAPIMAVGIGKALEPIKD